MGPVYQNKDNKKIENCEKTYRNGTFAVSLALASCDGGSTVTDENPFFTEWSTPFGMPPFDKIKTEHFIPAFEKGMEL